MYGVAGKVIEKASGKKWQDFITENLFHVLGMNRTYATYAYSSKRPTGSRPIS
jgi:CubicO group peptidase (beta-lactamase class C family)